ncbi:MAG: hypothetical protein EKK46_10000, partial [Rhodocyclaceae bacterium]
TGALDPNGTIVPITTDRGFTNHEHIDELGLIHMNGRIYDPVIGRFVSPDFQIPDPNDLQSYNRYSYVFNRPLVLTDSDGQCGLICVAVWVFVGSEVAHQVGIIDKGTARMIQGIAVAVALGPQGWAVGGTGTLGNALVAGFAGGYVGSDFNLKAGLYGAATGGIFYGVGSLAQYQGWGEGSFGSTALHAGAGCVTSSLQGGDCGSGALSAGFSEGVGGNLSLKGTDALIARMAIGGTASVLGGGKFGNGAVTAAFGYLFNDCEHGPTRCTPAEIARGENEGVTRVYPVEEVALGGGVLGKVGQVISRWFSSAADALTVTITDVTPVLVNAEGRGGIAAAEKLFDALPRAGNVTATETQRGVVRNIELQNGGTASIRPFSQTNPSGATVQINPSGARTIKVRYD